MTSYELNQLFSNVRLDVQTIQFSLPCILKFNKFLRLWASSEIQIEKEVLLNDK